jgi:hypothetical protein
VRDSRLFSPVVRDQVDEPIVIHVFGMTAAIVGRRSTIGSEGQRSHVDIGYVESVGAEDRNWDDAAAERVERVEVAAGLDVDGWRRGHGVDVVDADCGRYVWWVGARGRGLGTVVSDQKSVDSGQCIHQVAGTAGHVDEVGGGQAEPVALPRVGRDRIGKVC